jgi:predicted AAA+ superfamily ATPase
MVAPRIAELDRVLREQNPWHVDGMIPASLAREVERPMAQVLERGLRAERGRRFHLVLGPRRVGKTTAMYQTARRLLAAGWGTDRVWWLRLDHPVFLRTRLDELVRLVIERAGATEAKPVVLLLDELVYAPDWDLWLKTFFDDAWPVRIAATSSATAALRDRRMESGVGRWTEHYLSPYLLSEYLALIGAGLEVPLEQSLAASLRRAVLARVPLGGVDRARQELLLTGGFPELLLTLGDADLPSRLLDSQRVLRADAVERAVYKDIPQSFGVDSPLALERLLYVLADQTAGLLSPRNIVAQLDGLSAATFDRYLSYLERAFLVFTLPNYSGNETGVQRRGRKLYFVDAAVRNAALQRGLEPLRDPEEMGALAETQAAAHLHGLSLRTGVRVFHWRDGRREVDLVYDDPRAPVAIEIASSGRHSRSGLQAIAERFPRLAGDRWIVAPNVTPTLPEDSGDDVGLCPLELFLVVASAQAEAALQP